MMTDTTILKEGANCWRLEKAERAAFLVDAAAYFEAFVSVVKQAKHTVYIAGWDIDSRIQLIRNARAQGNDFRLGDFLNNTAARTPELQIYILSWDYSMIYATEREWLPVFKLGWKMHRRVHFRTDDEHPIGACHHQKFVVVDDTFAFCGGIDLTKNRWDTAAHRRDESRRKDPDNRAYPPFHDVQMAMEGIAAGVLGAFFRDRWRRATGQEISPISGEPENRWPESVEPEMFDIPVGVARTFPAYKDQQEIREVESSYKTAVDVAEKYIYVENQYLTSAAVTDALAACLKKPEGPEIVLVLPEKSSGWLEQSAMDSLRIRMLKHLKGADRDDRLRVFYPVSAGQSVYVHAKILVTDDRMAQVGSANLSNRSMAFDSECNLAVEATDERTARGIAGFRNRLLGEHLGVPADTVSVKLKETGSLIRTVESLSGSERTLKPVKIDQELPVDGVSLVKDPTLLDPEKPAELDRMLDHFTQDETDTSSKLHFLKPAVILAVLLGLAAAWRWTPLSEWIRIENMTAWIRVIETHHLAPVIVIGIYVLGSMAMFPVTVLVVTTALVFDPAAASIYALSGCLAGSMACYGIGAKLGKDTVSKLNGGRLNRLNRWISKPGILSVAIARNVPVVPFSVFNYLAGAWKLRLKDFLFGTAAGMAPGILAITLFTERLIEAVRNPQLGNIAVVAGIAVVFAAGLIWAKKRLFTR